MEHCWNESFPPVKNVITNHLSGTDTWRRGPNSRRPVPGLPLNSHYILLEQGVFSSYGWVRRSQSTQSFMRLFKGLKFHISFTLGGQICCMMHVKGWHLSKQMSVLDQPSAIEHTLEKPSAPFDMLANLKALCLHHSCTMATCEYSSINYLNNVYYGIFHAFVWVRCLKETTAAVFSEYTACVFLCVPSNVLSEQWRIGRVELHIEWKLPVVTWIKNRKQRKAFQVKYVIMSEPEERTSTGREFLGHVQQCYYEGSIEPSAHATHLSNAEQLLNWAKPGTSGAHTHTSHVA